MRRLLLLLVLGLATLFIGFAVATAMMGAGALGTFWFRADPGSLNAFQAGVQRYVAPGLWTGIVVPVLRQPAWLVAGTAAALFIAIYMALGSAWRRR
jgi:hypothetical protein